MRLRSSAGELVGDPGERLGAAGGVAVGLVLVAADDEPPARLALADPHLLDLQVVADGAVAARAGERLQVRASGAELLAEDVVAASALQVAAVLLGSEAGINDPEHPVELPGSQVVLDLADQHLVGAVAGEHPAAHRDPVPGHREADHDLRPVRPAVLRLAEPTQPDRLLFLVGLVLVVDLEVGRGRVEEDHVDLEVQQVRDREEHLTLDLLLAGEQEVHRPVEHLRIRPEPLDTGQADILRGPLERGPLRARLQRPAAHQREHEPLDRARHPPAVRKPPDRLVDPEPPPQLIEHIPAPKRPRPQEPKLAPARPRPAARPAPGTARSTAPAARAPPDRADPHARELWITRATT